jgi:cytoskeletal protein RodZ
LIPYAARGTAVDRKERSMRQVVAEVLVVAVVVVAAFAIWWWATS